MIEECFNFPCVPTCVLQGMTIFNFFISNFAILSSHFSQPTGNLRNLHVYNLQNSKFHALKLGKIGPSSPAVMFCDSTKTNGIKISPAVADVSAPRAEHIGKKHVLRKQQIKFYITFCTLERPRVVIFRVWWLVGLLGSLSLRLVGFSGLPFPKEVLLCCSPLCMCPRLNANCGTELPVSTEVSGVETANCLAHSRFHSDE